MKIKPNLSFLKNIKLKGKDNVKPIEWFKSDKEFKGLYKAEPEKIDRIVKDLAENGYDMSQAIIVTEDGSVIDGNSRIEAVRKYNLLYPDKPITELPYVVKEFDSKEDALLYEIHLNTDRRNIKDFDLMTSFIILNNHKEECIEKGMGTENYSDKKMSEILNVSERQVSKLRFILKNGSKEILDGIMNGECSINVAEGEIRKKLKPVSTEKKQIKTKDDAVHDSEIRINDFMLGVKFCLYSINVGKSPKEIWNYINSKDTISFTEEQLKIINSKISMN